MGFHNIDMPLMDIFMACFFPLTPAHKSIPLIGVMPLDCNTLQYMLNTQLFHQLEPITYMKHRVSQL